MKVIIDIPEKQYKYLAKIADVGEEPLGYFERVIMCGVPLPKGHGKIIDVNEAINYIDDYALGFFGFDDVPAIIEADTESEE